MSFLFWVHRLSLCLAFPFQVFVHVPELAGDARQWGQLGLCLCSLIKQLDQHLRFLMRYLRKTLDVVHRYALLVSNSDMLWPFCTHVE